MLLDGFIICLNISFARTLSLGVVVRNCVGDDIGYGVAVVEVDGFGAVV